MSEKVPFIVGYASLKSSLTIEEVGEILSNKVFGGLKFGGKELEIYEEVPAIFIQEPIMGLKIVLDGYSGFDEDSGFNLSVGPWLILEGFLREDVRIDNYLQQLLKALLIGNKNFVFE